MNVGEIEKVIQEYFDASYCSDGEGIAGVFHDGSHLYHRGEDGSLADWDKEFFVNRVGSRGKNPDPGYPRYEEILSIDFTGENTAVARVKIRVGQTLYTDILCFLRLGDKWGIMSKVFTGEPAE
jgi:hypothetical protein